MVFRAFKFKALLLTFIDQLLFTRKAAKDARRKPLSLEWAPINQDFFFSLKKKKRTKNQTENSLVWINFIQTNLMYTLFFPPYTPIYIRQHK